MNGDSSSSTKVKYDGTIEDMKVYAISECEKVMGDRLPEGFYKELDRILARVSEWKEMMLLNIWYDGDNHRAISTIHPDYFEIINSTRSDIYHIEIRNNTSNMPKFCIYEKDYSELPESYSDISDDCFLGYMTLIYFCSHYYNSYGAQEEVEPIVDKPYTEEEFAEFLADLFGESVESVQEENKDVQKNDETLEVFNKDESLKKSDVYMKELFDESVKEVQENTDKEDKSMQTQEEKFDESNNVRSSGSVLDEIDAVAGKFINREPIKAYEDDDSMQVQEDVRVARSKVTSEDIDAVAGKFLNRDAIKSYDDNAGGTGQQVKDDSKQSIEVEDKPVSQESVPQSDSSADVEKYKQEIEDLRFQLKQKTEECDDYAGRLSELENILSQEQEKRVIDNTVDINRFSGLYERLNLSCLSNVKDFLNSVQNKFHNLNAYDGISYSSTLSTELLGMELQKINDICAATYKEIDSEYRSSKNTNVETEILSNMLQTIEIITVITDSLNRLKSDYDNLSIKAESMKGPGESVKIQEQNGTSKNTAINDDISSIQSRMNLSIIAQTKGLTESLQGKYHDLLDKFSNTSTSDEFYVSPVSGESQRQTAEFISMYIQSIASEIDVEAGKLSNTPIDKALLLGMKHTVEYVKGITESLNKMTEDYMSLISVLKDYKSSKDDKSVVAETTKLETLKSEPRYAVGANEVLADINNSIMNAHSSVIEKAKAYGVNVNEVAKELNIMDEHVQSLRWDLNIISGGKLNRGVLQTVKDTVSNIASSLSNLGFDSEQVKILSNAEKKGIKINFFKNHPEWSPTFISGVIAGLNTIDSFGGIDDYYDAVAIASNEISEWQSNGTSYDKDCVLMLIKCAYSGADTKITGYGDNVEANKFELASNWCDNQPKTFVDDKARYSMDDVDDVVVRRILLAEGYKGAENTIEDMKLLVDTDNDFLKYTSYIDTLGVRGAELVNAYNLCEDEFDNLADNLDKPKSANEIIATIKAKLEQAEVPAAF
jgi:hypothetical protein